MNTLITFASMVGGLIGLLSNSKLSYAYYAGKIIVDADNVRGIVGAEGQNTLVPGKVIWDTLVSASTIGVEFDTNTLQQPFFWVSRNFDTTIWRLTPGKYPELINNP